MTLPPSLTLVGPTHSSPPYSSRNSAWGCIPTCLRRKPRTPVEKKKSPAREDEGLGTVAVADADADADLGCGVDGGPPPDDAREAETA
jgi:hypothetical protein